MADADQLYTAREAARALGRPHISQSLARRAKEAFDMHDPQIRRVGNAWAAPLETWRRLAADIPRTPGPKRPDWTC